MTVVATNAMAMMGSSAETLKLTEWGGAARAFPAV